MLMVSVFVSLVVFKYRENFTLALSIGCRVTCDVESNSEMPIWLCMAATLMNSVTYGEVLWNAGFFLFVKNVTILTFYQVTIFVVKKYQ